MAPRQSSLRSRLISILLIVNRLAISNASSVCKNPMGSIQYKLGEGPTAHYKRLSPTSKRWQDLNSVDYRAPAGTPVYAVVDGVICDPAENSTCVWGKTVAEMKDKFSLNSFYLLGSDDKTYYYTHLQSIAAKPGSAVKQGQVVGAIGAYNGQNAHLHLAVSSGNVCDMLKACKPTDIRVCK